MAGAPSIRPPAVAGSFYPAAPGELRGIVEALLAQAARSDRPEAPPSVRPVPKALVAPHAGYVYSGPVAASAFSTLTAAASSIRRVVLLGPAHRVAIAGLALPGDDAFATPLGTVPVDAAAVAAVAGLPQVAVDRRAHAPEHSLEVELPFLQLLLDDFQLLPLVVGEATADEVAEVLDRVWGGDETAIVISSDLSHYLPYETAREVDGETAREILRLEGSVDPRRACGAYPLNGFLQAAKRRGLLPRQLDLRSSGDTAGDRRQVVGYGAFAFHERA